jgi:ligand-binding SRPBCC domain-containing protein
MPRFETTEKLSSPLERVFDFFSRPANLVRISPPELHFQLLEGPEILTLGSRFTLQGRRWGVVQRIVNEVIVWEPGSHFVDAQHQGPFKKWRHTHAFEMLPDGGTRITDSIDYETPGGLLGLVLNAKAVQRELERVFAYRGQELTKIFRNGE